MGRTTSSVVPPSGRVVAAARITTCRNNAFSATRLVDMSLVPTYSNDMSHEFKTRDRSMPWNPDLPYNDLPLLPPSGDPETVRVLKSCVEARTAVARLEGTAARMPNPAVLVRTLPLLEARASTEIENIVTTNDRIFRSLALDDGARDGATKKALNYRHALIEAHASLEHHPMTTRTTEAICSRLLGVESRVRQVTGTRLANPATKEVIYSPPEAESHLRDLLANWELFVNAEDDLDPLVRLAVAHYQFEAIHPFTDGNGRTGRVINGLILVDRGLLSQPILYLSRYLLSRRADYYRLLLGVTRAGNWEDWILFMLAGIRETADWTSALIEQVLNLMEWATDLVKGQLPKIYSRELIETVFARPYSRIADLVEREIVHRQAAARHLKALVSVGLLEERRSGRDLLFVNRRMLELLTQE
jgi:cell filamentation protein, protein adenylyltransferase